MGHVAGTSDTMRAPQDEPLVRSDLRELRGDFYRALWIQGITIVTIVGGFIAIAWRVFE